MTKFNKEYSVYGLLVEAASTNCYDSIDHVRSSDILDVLYFIQYQRQVGFIQKEQMKQQVEL